MNFPTSYDDIASTFNDPNDMITLTLDGAINDSVTTITLNETADADALNFPGYLTFEKEVAGLFEIVKYTARPGAGQLTVVRGALGSTAQAHADGEQLVQDPVSAHLANLRAMLEAIQKFQGLVGLKAGLPGTCEPPETYIATDTGEVFYAVATNTWLLINRWDHGDYAGLTDDDHAQYHTAGRKDTWHTALTGEHITSPTTHDHDGSGTMCPPAIRLRHGTSGERPANPTVDRELYHETDTGYLFFGVSGSWVRYTVLPAYAGALFEGACPTGWTRVAALDDLMPRGAPPGVWSGFSHGATATHTHDMEDLVAHTHNIAIVVGSTSTGGVHDHDDIKMCLDIWDSGSWRLLCETPSVANNMNTTYAGGHEHAVMMPERQGSDVGQGAPVSNATDHKPPWRKLVFCEKD